MYFSEYEGVYFVEGMPKGAIVIENITTVVDGYFPYAQFRSLDDVKREMALQAKRKGGNAVVEFKYGQSTGCFLVFLSLFSLDNVRWRGEGKIAKVNPADFQ